MHKLYNLPPQKKLKKDAIPTQYLSVAIQPADSQPQILPCEKDLPQTDEPLESQVSEAQTPLSEKDLQQKDPESLTSAMENYQSLR